MGDGTRRAILARLLAEGPLAVNEIARDFPISRPAISQHLRVLKDAALVQDEQRGTRRVYDLNPAGFQVLHRYFDQFWTLALMAFKKKAEEPWPKGKRR